MKKIKDNLLLIYLVFNIAYICIGSFLSTVEVIDRLVFAIGMIFVLLPINIISIFLLRKKYKKNIVDFFSILIAIFGIIATIFAYKKGVSLFGETNRYEGIFMIIYYLSVLYLSTFIKAKDKKKVIYSILIVGIIEVLYAICQRYTLFGIQTYIHKGQKFAIGFTLNPNFFATLMIICICYSIGLFIDCSKNKIRVCYYVLILLFTVGILISNTLSVVVGLFFVIGYSIVYAIKYKKKLPLLIVILGILAISTIFHFCKLTTLGHDLNVFKDQTTSLVDGTATGVEYYGSGRLYLWKKTMKVVPKYLFTGVGIDNFKYIMYGGSAIIRGGMSYDKAHNEYLQLLVTGGLWYLLSFLSLYFYISIKGIKSSFKKKELYLILPIIGYLVQAFFNISVIEVAPFFFIALGLCLNRFEVE